MTLPQNKTLIEKYLNHYNHSPQSKKMRESSLRFFFGRNFPLGNGKKDETWFNFAGHIFEIDNEIIIDYFDYLNTLETLSISTRKNKWHIFTSFLNYTVYIYGEKYGFIVVKPPREFINFENALPKKTKVKTNKKVFATKEELKKILNYLEVNNFTHYLIFRLFIETGSRKGELINTKYYELNPEERYVNPSKGKKGEKYYFYSETLAILLNLYLNERKKMNASNDYLFLSKKLTKYNLRAFNLMLKGNITKDRNGKDFRHIGILEAVGITKNITCHTLRRTINDLRKDMDCSNEDRKILLGHAVTDVNVKSYTNSDYKKLRGLYDKWDPYKDLNL